MEKSERGGSLSYSLALSVVVSLLLAMPCYAASIGLYVNPDGTGGDLRLAMGDSATIYVIARPGPGPCTYARRGLFRIVGLPERWIATAIPVDAGGGGDPLGDGVIFSLAEPLFNEPLPVFYTLYTVVVNATTSEENVALQVLKHLNPPPYLGIPIGCPWFIYENGSFSRPPCFEGACAEGIGLTVNRTATVETTTWTSVRSLYR